MQITPNDKTIQNLSSVLTEVMKRMVRVEAKLTQLMLHQGMHFDGRQRIERRVQAMIQHALHADGRPRLDRRLQHV